MIQTEQVLAREHAERALAEAQGRISQLTQTFQQGTRVTGNVVDTRVFGKQDKWYVSEKAWPKWSFVAKAYAGAIDQLLSDDMTVLDNDSVSPESQARSVQLYFILIMLCIGRALDSIANVTLGVWERGVYSSKLTPQRIIRGWL